MDGKKKKVTIALLISSIRPKKGKGTEEKGEKKKVLPFYLS